ncbi:MAG TPA: DUF6527 family protein [Ignavibacteriales bacterium]|nr:DUF6527 family protein [Ignavibacteriales bacterium]
MANVIRAGQNGYRIFLCPACKHRIALPTYATQGPGPKWEFNGDFEKPTFAPSILTRWNEGEEQKPKVCHSFIRNGMIEFLPDCTHELAGKTVPLEPIGEE